MLKGINAYQGGDWDPIVMCPDTSLGGGYYATTLCSTIPVVAIGHWLWIRESELGGGRDFPKLLVYYPFGASVVLVQLRGASL